MRPITSFFFLRVAVLVLLWSLSASTLSSDEPKDSLQLQVLERDLSSADYQAVLKTMIPTDLAAEWQRVATPDNYWLYAKRHGGVEAVASDVGRKADYDRRKKIAEQFLERMRSAYAAKRIKPPFDDEAVLHRVLESADRQAKSPIDAKVTIGEILPCPDAEKHWPIFRGPSGQGIVSDTNAPLEWSDAAKKNILWREDLPGRGNSSPVVWGKQLFVTSESSSRPVDAPLTASDEASDRLLLCYSTEDGRLLWKLAAPKPAEHEVLYWKNTLASSTPVTDGERVIAFFGNAGLLCSDLQGKQLWHVDLGLFPTTHGPGSSPILYRDLVIVIQDQNRGKSLCAAYKKSTGEKVWQRDRKNSMGWSNPVLCRVGAQDQLLFNGSNEVMAYDPATGEELWSVSGTSIESIPMIVRGDELLYSVSGRNGPMFAFRPGGHSVQGGQGGQGDVTATNVVWRMERGGPHVPTPAYLDGFLYVVNDTGIVTCLDGKSGETIWQKRLKGRFSTSPLVIGKHLLLISEDGISYVLKSGRKFEVVQENDLDESIYATPAFAGGRIYFRTVKRLVCVGG